jgi:hypothetical protein
LLSICIAAEVVTGSVIENLKGLVEDRWVDDRSGECVRLKFAGRRRSFHQVRSQKELFRVTEVWLFEATYTARALRRLKPDPVPEELITTVPMRRSGRHLGGTPKIGASSSFLTMPCGDGLRLCYRKASDEVAERYDAHLAHQKKIRGASI